jgi:hypothetical protein
MQAQQLNHIPADTYCAFYYRKTTGPWRIHYGINNGPNGYQLGRKYAYNSWWMIMK